MRVRFDVRPPIIDAYLSEIRTLTRPFGERYALALRAPLPK